MLLLQTYISTVAPSDVNKLPNNERQGSYKKKEKERKKKEQMDINKL